jgi:hypothetical protein
MSVVAYDYGRFKYTCTRVNILQQISLSLAFFRNLALRDSSYCLRYLTERGIMYLNYYQYLPVVKFSFVRSTFPRVPNQIAPNP